MRHLWTACLFLAVAAPAYAEDGPQIFPTRDVTVTYETASKKDITVAYSAALHRARLDGMSAQHTYAIVQHDKDQMVLVMPERQMVMRMPEPPAMKSAISMQGFSSAKRVGSATVAGVSCTVWAVHNEDGDGDICVTSDGVLLRARGKDKSGNSSLMQATKVDYHALPASEFEVPAGYHAMNIPGMPPGAMPPGAKPTP
jgi:Domain of unknown function (DUF4412)